MRCRQDPRVKAISFVGVDPIPRYVYETGTFNVQTGAGVGRREEPTLWGRRMLIWTWLLMLR